MSINLLTRSVIQNTTSDVGLTWQELSRQDLQKIAGIRTGTVSVSGSCYICLDINVKNPFYCKDFTMEVSSATPSGHAAFQAQSFLEWRGANVITESGKLSIDFSKVLPDQAQLIYRLQFTYANFDSLPSNIYSCSLLTVDYPVDFDFVQFSIAASSYGNAPIKIYNNSVQQVEQNIRVLPPFSGDYSVDSVFVLTESGKDDTNKYSLQKGFRFPEDAGWDTGRTGPYPSVTLTSGKICDGGTNPGTTSIVPAMTNNTTPPPYVASASSIWNSNYDAYGAFDQIIGDINHIWHTAYLVSTPHWLKIDLGSSKLINKYRLRSRDRVTDRWFPRDWVIEGSNNNSTWDTLDTRFDIDDPGQATWTPYYVFINTVFYRYYRIYITKSNLTDYYACIGELHLVEAETYDPNKDLSGTNLVVENRMLTMSGTVTSGTWTSPVIYIPDEDYVAMYIYGEDLGDNSFIEKDFKRINNLIEVRSSDQSPLPNFFISSWTQRLYRGHENTDVELQLPSRTPYNLTYQDTQDYNSGYWMPDGGKVPVGGDPRTGNHFLVPYIKGRTKRMYVKGDGTIMAQAPVETDESTMWEYAHRGYDIGIPYKEFGDINAYWNVGQFINLLGCTKPPISDNETTSATMWHRMSFSSETDSSNWAQGKNTSSKLSAILPLAYHFNPYGLGDGIETLYGDAIGSYTMAVDTHPNEWMVVTGFMYPWSSGDKYMCLYYLHIRNYWVADVVYLGSYGIGQYPCDEGWASCKASDGGFWLHVGYMDRILDKYDIEGNLIISNRTNYGFNAIRVTRDPAGIWGIRNDAVYWYSENSSGELTEEFSITYDNFKYLQAGDVDDYNNLWLVDRDGGTVYRINFANRMIDYEKELAYAAGVWPHPRDGSAFLYTSFNANTFSTSVDRIWMDDPYGYRETLFSLPEFPISDYSGVHFMGRGLSSYLTPSINDPIWGTNDAVTLEWQPYPNASLTLPGGKYKQFRITLQRSSISIIPPKLSKIRIPKSLILNQVGYKDYKEVYINPHLRYNKKYGHFTTDLVVWWPH